MSTIYNQYKFRVKLLIWETKEFSLGTYISISTLLGFSIGALPLSLTIKNTLQKKRKVVYEPDKSNIDNLSDFETDDYNETTPSNKYIERDIRDPSPTLSVPYKIIKRSSSESTSSENDNFIYNQRNNIVYENDEENGYSTNPINQSDDWSNTLDDKW